MKALVCAGMFALGIPLSASLPAHAQEPDSPSRWSVWSGVAGGASHLNPGRTEGEKRKNGYHLRADGLLGLAHESWDFEVGLGFLYNHFWSKKGEETRLKEDGTYEKEADLHIRSRTPDLSLVVRREVLPGFRFGPLARLLLDPSVSFTKTQKHRGPHATAGVQGVYDTDFVPSLADRVLLDVTTDVTIPHRQVFFVTLGFQLGVSFEGWAQANASAEAAEVQTQSPPVETPKVRVVLDGQLVNFDTAKATLAPELETFVRRLGGILKFRDAAWESLRIEGHTDSRGSQSYNLELSAKRAATIKTLLVEEGVVPMKISTEGFGPNRPAVFPEVTAEDFKKNRRVLFVFDGVPNPALLQSEIRALREELNLVEATALPH